MKNDYVIGIIGAGNMGEALIKGLLRAGLVRPYEIIASARTLSRRRMLEKTYGVHTTHKNDDIVRSSNTVILAVKPQDMSNVCETLAPLCTKQHLIISIAAGIDLARLQRLLGAQPSLVRTMPNLPAVIDQGVTAIACAPGTPQRSRRFAHQIFQAVGHTVDVEEKYMDAVTALSGTGPAYIFALMEALEEAGKKAGLPPALARKLTALTTAGAAAMASEHADPKYLRAQVTSKRGTTWAAMQVLSAHGFWHILASAVVAAKKRAGELRRQR